MNHFLILFIYQQNYALIKECLHLRNHLCCVCRGAEGTNLKGPEMAPGPHFGLPWFTRIQAVVSILSSFFLPIPDDKI